MKILPRAEPSPFDLLTLSAAAKFAGRSRGTVLEALRKGDLLSREIEGENGERLYRVIYRFEVVRWISIRDGRTTGF